MPELDLKELLGALRGRYRVDEAYRPKPGEEFVVYRARDLSRQEPVDLNVFSLAGVQSERATGIAERIQALEQLDHPHVLPVYATGREDDFVWWVSPFIGGVTIREKIDAHGPAPVSEVVRSVLAAATALQYGHARGHGHGRLAAESVHHVGRLVLVSRLGVESALATPGAPASNVGHLVSSDVRALGRLAFEMLTGEADVAAPEPALRAVPGLPTELADLVCRCLSDDPTVRPESMDVIRSFIQQPTTGDRDGVSGTTDSPTPDRIGPYEVQGVMGEGGMGIVYLAQQAEPIPRRVAIKVIKPGLDSQEVLRRFELERRTLAVLDHPGLATVHDAGVTTDGRPYFAMEVFAGEALTKYCDHRSLDTRARIRLLIEVCEAVRHAHQHGIVHRDLKPSNILVSAHHGRPEVRVIDFGLAKAIDSPLGEDDPKTRIGQIVGTPEYMSPEQAGISPLAVDTRTDVYSIGVVLHELLVGALPAGEGGAPLHRTTPAEDPTPPSRRLSGMGDRIEQVAQDRSTKPLALTRTIRGDLDWIVMRALAFDPGDRYQSIDALSADLNRYLTHDPVEARPPSSWYQLRKWVRRHRAIASSVAVGVMMLLVGITVSTALMMRATRAEEAAAQEAALSEEVSDLLIRLLFSANPTSGGGDTLTVGAVLERARARIDEELPDQPVLRARLLSTMGAAHSGMGQPEDAIELGQEALRLAEEELGPEHPNVLTILRELGISHLQAGDRAAALPVFERVLSLEEQQPERDDLALAYTLIRLSEFYYGAADYARALETAERSLQLRESMLGSDHINITGPLLMIAQVHIVRGNLDRAQLPLERATTIRERELTRDDMGLTTTRQLLANLLVLRGRPEEAEAVVREALLDAEGAFGESHYLVGFLLNDLASALHAQELYAGADSAFTRSLDILDGMFGPNNDYSLRIRQHLGEALTERESFDEAVVVFSDLLDHLRATLPPSDPELARVLAGYGTARASSSDSTDAHAAFEEARAIMLEHEPAHVVNTTVLHAYARFHHGKGQLHAADTVYSELLDLRVSALEPGEAVEFFAEVAREHATVLQELGRHREAEALLESIR